MRLSIPGHTMHRIGGDGGLAIAPTAIPAVPTTDGVSNSDPSLGLMLVPGERADVVFTPIGEAGSKQAIDGLI